MYTKNAVQDGTHVPFHICLRVLLILRQRTSRTDRTYKGNPWILKNSLPEFQQYPTPPSTLMIQSFKNSSKLDTPSGLKKSRPPQPYKPSSSVPPTHHLHRTPLRPRIPDTHQDATPANSSPVCCQPTESGLPLCTPSAAHPMHRTRNLTGRKHRVGNRPIRRPSHM